MLYRSVAKGALAVASRCHGLADGVRGAFDSRRPEITAPAPDAVRHLLVWSMDRLGDVARATPALRALAGRFAAARLCVVGPARSAPILRANPHVDELHEISSPYRLNEHLRVLRRLRGTTWDLGVLLEVDPHWTRAGHWVMQRLGVRHQICFDFGAGVPRGALGVRFDDDGSWVDQFNRLAGAVGAGDGGTRTEIFTTAAEREWADEFLAGHDVGPAQAFFLIHPGGNFLTVSRQWPPTSFAKLVDLLRDRWPWPVLVTGVAQEQAIADQIGKHARAPIVDLCGQLNLRQLVAVIERASVCIMNDTGPLHIAQALGRPTVAILGPTAPRVVGIAPNTAVVRKDLPCSPCAFLDGWKACANPVRWECLSGLSPHEVLKAL